MNLQTTYMGLNLRSPIVVSACPLSENIDNVLLMEKAGAGAVVLFSLFEEQVREKKKKRRPKKKRQTLDPGAGYFPAPDQYHVGVEEYLELIREAKENVRIPIIASLNGTTCEGWVDYSLQLEKAGADALEINVFYIPSNPRLSGQEIEERYVQIVQTVSSKVTIPVSIKLSPYFTALGNVAGKLREAGADALVLFNRFYQPDFDIAQLKVLSNLEYSHANEIRLPLLWIAALHERVGGLSLAATTGVQSAREVIKYLLAGADVAMTASAIYKYGIDYIQTMLEQMEEWMQSMHFESIDAFKGILSQRNIEDPTVYHRANYIRILENTKSIAYNLNPDHSGSPETAALRGHFSLLPPPLILKS